MNSQHAIAVDRHAVDQRHAGLDFSLLLPLGWQVRRPAQPLPPSLSSWVELARADAPAGQPGPRARLVVAGCARSDAGSLEAALVPMLASCGLGAARDQLQALQIGRHRGLAVSLSTPHRGRSLGLRVALLEDDGRLLRLVLSAPEGPEALQPQLWATVAGGLVLDAPRDATLPLFDPAGTGARAASPGRAVQHARQQLQRARRLAAAGDREGARRACEQARRWAALHAGAAAA